VSARAARQPAILAPQSRDEATAWLGQVGEAERARAMLELHMNDVIAGARAAFEEAAAPHAARAAALRQGIEAWAAANRAALTMGLARKSVELATGTIAWRTMPPAVAVKQVAVAIAWVTAHRLEKFLRLRVALDKEALLKDPAAAQQIPGVRIAQEEKIVITAATVALEEKP